MPTTVVNLRRDKYSVYIGRPSMFGNPFIIDKDGSRDEVIMKYREYFYHHLESEPEFKKAVEELRGKTLGCYCHPLPCHGDIIAEYLNKS